LKKVKVLFQELLSIKDEERRKVKSMNRIKELSKELMKYL
jgi:hypothetical protein